MLTLERVSMKRSDIPFSKTTPLIYEPLFLYGKNLTPTPQPPSFRENFENSNTFPF